jgi:large subunit ribosomal protein L13
MKTQKSHQPKTVKRVWHEIDAAKQPLGRVSTRIANLLRGKHKRDFTPHIDGGDFVVVINAEKLNVTGKKMEQKMYHHYSGYPGGVRTKAMKNIMQEHPDDIVRRAVFNMIDDFKLRKPIMRRLRIISGDKHEFVIDGTSDKNEKAHNIQEKA